MADRLELVQGTLEMLEGFAKMQNKSLDEALKSGLANNDQQSEKMPETFRFRPNTDSTEVDSVENSTVRCDAVEFSRLRP